MDEGKELIADVARMDENEQEALLVLYAKGTVDFKIRVHSEHRMILNMIYNEDENIELKDKLGLDVLSYISLLLAIKLYYAKTVRILDKATSSLCVKEIVDIDTKNILALMS